MSSRDAETAWRPVGGDRRPRCHFVAGDGAQHRARFQVPHLEGIIAGPGDGPAAYVGAVEAQAVSIKMQEIQDTKIDEFRKTDNTYKGIVNLAIQEFSYSPREIKRFTNTYAVQYAMLLVRQSLGLDAPTQEQLRRWVILWMKWPRLALWIMGLSDASISDSCNNASYGGSPVPAQRSSTPGNAKRTLSLLEQTGGANGGPDQTAWQCRAVAALGLDSDEAPWLTDGEVWQFFLQESQQAEPLSTGAGKGFW